MAGTLYQGGETTNAGGGVASSDNGSERDGVGEREPECAAFLLAADGVVGEQDRKERKDDLEDKVEIKKSEDGIHRVIAVSIILGTHFTAAADLRSSPDIVRYAHHNGRNRLRGQ